jgi:hypothetical protein
LRVSARLVEVFFGGRGEATDEFVILTRGVNVMRGADAYALGYCGMVGWKINILMELSTPLTVVATSAWDSVMSMVPIGSPKCLRMISLPFHKLTICARNLSVRDAQVRWPRMPHNVVDDAPRRSPPSRGILAQGPDDVSRYLYMYHVHFSL